MNNYSVFAWMDDWQMSARLAKLSTMHSYDLNFYGDDFTVYENKIHMFQADLLVTERCNLSCTYCNMFMPYYKAPKHSNLDMVINDIDMFFNSAIFSATCITRAGSFCLPR